jgi:hypothetical protein
MKVKLSDVLFTQGTHTVDGITLKVSADKQVRAYIDGELFLYSPAGMSIGTRVPNNGASQIRVKNALNKIFKAVEYPIVWAVESGGLCFTVEGESFGECQSYDIGTTYAYHLSGLFHWRVESARVNEFMYQELKAERYL